EGTGPPGGVVPAAEAPPAWPAVPLPVPPPAEVPPAPPAPPGVPLPAPPALPAPPGAPPAPVAGFFGQPVRASEATKRRTTTNVVCQDRPVMRRSFSRTAGCMNASHGPTAIGTAGRCATSGPSSDSTPAAPAYPRLDYKRGGPVNRHLAARRECPPPDPPSGPAARLVHTRSASRPQAPQKVVDGRGKGLRHLVHDRDGATRDRPRDAPRDVAGDDLHLGEREGVLGPADDEGRAADPGEGALHAVRAARLVALPDLLSGLEGIREEARQQVGPPGRVESLAAPPQLDEVGAVSLLRRVVDHGAPLPARALVGVDEGAG